jgi:hypothetical protein
MWKSKERDLIFSIINEILFVKRFLDVIKDEISQAQGKEEHYFGNPINTYLFIKHLTVEWDLIKKMVSPGTFIKSILIFLIDLIRCLSRSKQDHG